MKGLRLASGAAALLAAVGGVPAHAADQPGLTIGTGPAIDPTAAQAYYGNPASPAAPSSAHPLVAELARSLNYDIDLIFEHVRDTVGFVPIYGVQKGAAGALQDGAGTAFDQAQLLVELLRECDRVAGRGYGPRYKLGRITLTGTQFNDWFGISNADVARRVLANGGIPATVNGTGATITSVTMSHIWVDASIGGISYVFDPALKTHIRNPKIDVAAITGYNRTTLLSAASTGAIYDAVSVRNFNTGAFSGQLTQYRANLESYLRTNLPGRRIGNVVGSLEILPHPASENRRTALPYAIAEDATWTGAIPNIYRTAVTLTMGSGSSGTLYADDIYGKTFQYYFGYVGSWSLGGTGLEVFSTDADQCSMSSTPNASKPFPILNVAINHPYAASGGAYMDRTLSKQMTSSLNNGACTSGYFLFTFDFGAQGTKRLAELRRAASRAALSPTPGSGIISAPTLKDVGVAFSRYLQLADQQLDLVTQVHDMVGVHHVDSAWSRRSDGGGASVTWSPQKILSIDFEAGLSASSRIDVTAARIEAAKVVSTLGMALAESVVPRQELDSTREVTPLTLTSDQDQIANSPGQYRHFVASPATWTSIRPTLQQYSSGALAALDTYVANGYSVMVPERGDLSLGSYSIGSTNVRTVDESNGSSFFRQGFMAFRSGANGLDSAGILTFNPRRGRVMKGTTAVKVEAPDGRGLKMPDVPKPESRDPVFAALQVSPRNGALSYSPPPDLRDGTGDAPFALTFQRTYSSADISDVGLGIGWSHNWNNSLNLSGDSLATFGENGALGAATALVAQLAAFDLALAPGEPRILLAMVKSQQWLTSQSLNNMVTVQDATGGGGTFFRMANGTFAAASPDGGLLVQNGVPVDTMINRWAYHPVSFVATAPDGSQRTYNYVGAEGADLTQDIFVSPLTRKSFHLSSWAHPSGVKASLLFQREPLTTVIYMHRVSNSLGNIIQTAGITVGDEGDSAYCTSPYHNQAPSYRPYAPGSIKYRDSANNEVLFEKTPSYAFRVSIRFIEDGGNCGMNGFLPGTTRISAANLIAANDAAPIGQPTGPKWQYRTVVQGIGVVSVLSEIYKPSNATTPAARIAWGNDENVRSLTNGLNFATLYRNSVRRFEKEDPLGARSVTYSDDSLRPVRALNPLGATTSTVYDDAGLVMRTVSPEGDAVENLYDARGNKTRECRIAKGRVAWESLANPKTPQCNSALGDLVTTISYVEGPTLRMDQCVNLKTCNKPASVIDPRGNRTDYSWDGVHGGLLSQTSGLNVSGACTVAGGCPLITYAYTSFTGTDGALFYRLSSKTEKIDVTTSTVTTYAYDPANRFQLMSQTADSGNLNLRTCGRFDAVGNLVSVSDPRQVTCP